MVLSYGAKAAMLHPELFVSMQMQGVHVCLGKWS